MDINETRRANLEILISMLGYKRRKDFAKDAGISESYLTQLTKGQKNLGPLARDIEDRLRALGKDITRGWFDVPRGTQAEGRVTAEVFAVIYAIEAFDPDVRDCIKRLILAISKSQIGMVPRTSESPAIPLLPAPTAETPPPTPVPPTRTAKSSVPPFAADPDHAKRKSAPVQALQRPAKKRTPRA